MVSEFFFIVFCLVALNAFIVRVEGGAVVGTRCPRCINNPYRRTEQMREHHGTRGLLPGPR